MLHSAPITDGPACRTSVPIPTSSSRKSRRRRRQHAAGGCASTSARRPASARPTRCSRRRERSRNDRHGRRRRRRRDARPQGNRGAAAGPRDPARAQVEYQGRKLQRVRPRRRARRASPALILVDELAHTNVAGSRHPKRWQDVEELLASGIDVFTTLNVQHLESLNDVVGGITGIRVRETVPDTFFDDADEVMLVDIPADDLLARLKAGKVYAARAGRARGAQLLPQGQPDGAARARAAPHRRPRRGRRPGVPRRPGDRPRLEDRSVAPVLHRPATPAASTSCAAPRGSRSSSASSGTPSTSRRPALQRLPAPNARAHPARRSSSPQELGATTAILPGRRCRRR